MEEILMTEEFSKVLNSIPWKSICEIAVNLLVLIILSKIKTSSLEIRYITQVFMTPCIYIIQIFSGAFIRRESGF